MEISLGKVTWTGKESKYDIGLFVEASGKRPGSEIKTIQLLTSNNVEPGTANK